MATIPLPALDVQPLRPQGDDPMLSAMVKIQQLRQMQQQQMLGQIQMQTEAANAQIAQQNAQDMQNSTRALMASNGDPQSYLDQLRQSGVSGNFYVKAQTSLLD